MKDKSKLKTCIIVKGRKNIVPFQAMMINSCVFIEHEGNLKIECTDNVNKWQINIYISSLLRKYIGNKFLQKVGN